MNKRGMLEEPRREYRLQVFYPYTLLPSYVEPDAENNFILPFGIIAYREISEITNRYETEDRQRQESGMVWMGGTIHPLDRAAEELDMKEDEIEKARRAGAVAFIRTSLPSNHYFFKDDRVLDLWALLTTSLD